MLDFGRLSSLKGIFEPLKMEFFLLQLLSQELFGYVGGMRQFWTMLLIPVFGSCSFNKKEKDFTKNLAQVPKHLAVNPEQDLQNAVVTYGGEQKPTSESPQGGLASLGIPAGLPGIPKESDIIWTDADDPDAVIPELEDRLAKGKVQTWYRSYKEAKRAAMRQSKPLLLWFTNSRGQPNCQNLAEECFGDSDFESWVIEKMIRCRLDFNISEKDIDLRLDQKFYLERLKKQYGVRGLPAVVILTPSGSNVAHYRGYRKGNSAYYLGRIQQAHRIAESRHEQWEKKMKSKGYRRWQDRKGRAVFAKLKKYSKGVLWIIEPDGTRSKITESKLSNTDQIWIAEQKLARSME